MKLLHQNYINELHFPRCFARILCETQLKLHKALPARMLETPNTDDSRQLFKSMQANYRPYKGCCRLSSDDINLERLLQVTWCWHLCCQERNALTCTSVLILEDNWVSLFQTEHHTCCACGEAIADRFLLEVGGATWHTSCLRCCVCAVQLDRHPSCFLRDRQVYCKQDYVKWVTKLRQENELVLCYRFAVFSILTFKFY